MEGGREDSTAKDAIQWCQTLMFLSMRQESLSCPLIGWLLRCKIFELKNISITWRQLLCLHAIWPLSTMGSSQMPDCAARPWTLRSALVCRCVVGSCQTYSGEENQPFFLGQHQEQCQASSSYSHLPCWGQGFCPFLLSPYLSSGRRRKKAAESNEKSFQELVFCSSLSGQISFSLSYFQFLRVKEKSFGDLQALGERSFRLVGPEHLDPFPSPGFGLDESQTKW